MGGRKQNIFIWLTKDKMKTVLFRGPVPLIVRIDAT